MKKLLIGITGTPGVGKSLFSEELAKRTGAEVVELNDIVKEGRLYSYIDNTGAAVAKTDALSRAVIATSLLRTKTLLIVGHLLPELSIKFDIIVILRLDPAKLISRLEKRNYTREKIRENIIAEALDYCGGKAREHGMSKEIYEINADSAMQKAAMLSYMEKRAKGLRAKEPAQTSINSMPALIKIAKGAQYGI